MRETFEWWFGRVLSPFERFLRRTTAGGIVLVGTTLVAIALCTAFGSDAYEHFWDIELELSLGDASFGMPLRHWINDALMAVFFLGVGLELKREILVGELASLKDSALPVIAAFGGMIVPALIFAALNAGSDSIRGWGIPMATDIAFAVGILVLLAWRIPRNLIVFLTALAIADDLGAALVIAIFYSGGLDWTAILAAALALAAAAALNLGNVRHPLPYAIAGIVLWIFMHRSGVHSTIAGVLLAAAIPARKSAPALDRWHEALTPWVTFVVIPVFALANAGIDLLALRIGDVRGSPLALGVFAGLVVGKFLGIAGFSALAVRSGIARLPSGVQWRHLLGAAWLGGIGFTMSLFIAQLAFTDAATIAGAKLGILAASAVSAAIGLAWLYVAGRRAAS